MIGEQPPTATRIGAPTILREDSMTLQHTIDRRRLLGAAGALTMAATPALPQEPKPAAEARPPAPPARRLSDTIADFVAGFDPATLPPLAIERARLAFIDTFAVMLAGGREEGSQIVCEMVQHEEAAPKVSVVGQSFKTSPQLAALANGVAAHIMDYDVLAAGPADLADHPGAAAAGRNAPARRPPR